MAAVGLYGLLAFSVTRRTSELGVRLALGATRRAVLRHVLRDGLRLVFAGLAVGAPVALAVSHLAASRVSGLVFGLSAADPVTMAGAAARLTVVAAVAAYLPAARASRIDPAVALRAESPRAEPSTIRAQDLRRVDRPHTSTIVAVDVREAAWRLASDAGAHPTVRSDHEAAAHIGDLVGPASGGADVVIDCVGSPATVLLPALTRSH